MNAKLRGFLLELLMKGYIVGFESEVVEGRVRVFIRSPEDVRKYNLPEGYEGVKLEYVSIGELELLKAKTNTPCILVGVETARLTTESIRF